MKEEIRKSIQKVLEKSYPEHADIDFSVEYAPSNIETDFASNVALILAKKVGEKPMEVAERMREVILEDLNNVTLEGAKRSSVTLEGVRPGRTTDRASSEDPIAPFSRSRMTEGAGGLQNDISIKVAPPGFLNFTLDKDIWHKELEKILKQGNKYGSSSIGKGKKINLESVSANPTGPLTVGHGRGAIIGLVLGNVLKSQGYDVTRDYYYNNGGLQMKKLGESVKLRVEEELGSKIVFAEDLYQGGYIKDIAKKFIKEKVVEDFSPPRGRLKPSATSLQNDNLDKYSKFAANVIFKEIKGTLKSLGVPHDNYFNELSLFDEKTKGNIWEVLEKLEKQGVIYKKEEAFWLKLDGENDRVLVRSTGEPTYRLPDIAYHAYKLGKYDQIINILGSDHQDQYPDIKYAVSKLGYDPEAIKVIIHQFVTLKGKKMSTRTASYVTLGELIREVGPDVVKFFMAMNSANSHMNFDLALAKDTSDKNPVFKVQYAHARINSIMKKAKEEGVILEGSGPKPVILEGAERPIGSRDSIALLQNDAELELIKELSKYPEMLGEVSTSYATHHVPHYLLGLADKLHSFYENIRVISDDDELTKARMALMTGVRTVIANGLQILGIEPLKRM